MYKKESAVGWLAFLILVSWSLMFALLGFVLGVMAD